MACLRCGSAWKTRWGKDKLSCPECCKQQRAKARRLGHLPSSQTKVCERCGDQFEAVGGNAIAHMTCCPKCRDEKALRRERHKRYQERVKAGLVIPKKRSEPQPERKCLRCGIVMRRKQQVKYCSNACFIADRNDGVQQWNREGQVNANLRRCGISMLPSQVGLRLVRSGFCGFMANCGRFRKESQDFIARHAGRSLKETHPHSVVTSAPGSLSLKPPATDADAQQKAKATWALVAGPARHASRPLKEKPDAPPGVSTESIIGAELGTMG